MTNIGECAFCGCDGLISVNISNGVTNIKDFAFGGCKSLTTLTIPSTVTNIGEGALYDCYSLETVYIYNNEKVLLNDVYCPFRSVADGCVLYVAKGMKEAYDASPYAEVFSQIIEMSDEETGIENAGMSSGKPGVKAVYGLDGSNVKSAKRGVSIMRYSDGTVRKVFEK